MIASAVRYGWDAAGPTPDPAWQRELDRIAPRTEYGHDWLLLRWEPGDFWDPIERWTLWTMRPESRIDTGKLRMFYGPNPRSLNQYDERTGRLIVHDNTIGISYQSWSLFQQYHCEARLYWIIQGSAGGHLKQFDDVQTALSIMSGGPEQPPIPGELPYAEPDNRVWEKIRALDVVMKFGDILEPNLTDHTRRAMLKRREREQILEMARQLSKWMDSQVEESLDLSWGQSKTIRENAMPGLRPLDGDEVEESFQQHILARYG